jgi:hypothetical protein
MRSGVGAICILDFAVRDDAAALFFAAVEEDEPDFTVVVGFFVCAVVLVGFADALDFAAADVDVVAVDCAIAAGAIKQIHKPPAINSPPAARRILVCVLTNAPR